MQSTTQLPAAPHPLSPSADGDSGVVKARGIAAVAVAAVIAVCALFVIDNTLVRAATPDTGFDTPVAAVTTTGK